MAKGKVLLVDDEESITAVFSQILQTGGYDVITAKNGNDAFAKATSELPNVILLDQILSDTTGNQILQQLKHEPKTQNIPVAMLTNFNQDNFVKEAVNAGASDYLLKYQISPEDLIAKVNQLMNESVKREA